MPTVYVGAGPSPITEADALSQAAAASAETTVWQHRAALLDPDAYEYVTGTGWTRTVPPGTCWWALNMWYVRTSNGAGYQFVRVADANAAVPLPAGTVVKADASHQGLMYVCKPETVIAADSRYVSNPRCLYFGRLARLLSLPQLELANKLAIGALPGWSVDALWPAGVTRGIVLQASVNDASWVTLTNAAGGINLLDEISDDRAQRLGRGITCPFKTSDFTGIRIRAGNVSGNLSDPATMEGFGFIRYVSLPADW